MNGLNTNVRTLNDICCDRVTRFHLDQCLTLQTRLLPFCIGNVFVLVRSLKERSQELVPFSRVFVHLYDVFFLFSVRARQLWVKNPTSVAATGQMSLNFGKADREDAVQDHRSLDQFDYVQVTIELAVSSGQNLLSCRETSAAEPSLQAQEHNWEGLGHGERACVTKGR